MKPSIRQFLLINLLLAIVITITLTAIGSYYLDKKEIQDHLDTLMAISALSNQALLADDLHKRSLDKIQQGLNVIPKTMDHYYRQQSLSGQPPRNILDNFNFQVWSKEGNLLLHSPTAPKTPLTGEHNGFHDKLIGRHRWRIFTSSNDEAGIKLALAERHSARNELGRRIMQDDLTIMLLTFPLSGLLIWIIIGRGLSSLDRVAQEVAHRAPAHLQPVSLEEIPKEIKPVVDELNHLLFRLKEGFEREKRFAADAAHELRTPLAALKTQAQVALNINDIDEKNAVLQKLISSVNRTTHIVQQLLTMSKLVPESAIVHELDEVNLLKIVREVLAILAPSAVEKQIELEFNAHESLPSFSGNSTALSILVNNLVDNAIRYCNEQGKVRVGLYAQHGELLLEVRDNGPGIPKELRERVFERFFRVLGNKSSGSGLGLAIVRQIINLYGGRIELDCPSEGTGLIVRVYFPM